MTRCMSLVPLLCILLYILLCNVEGLSTTLFHSYIIPSTSIVSYIYLLVIERSDTRMSVGTSDTTVISSTKTEARNLNAIDASTAQRDDSSPAPKNRQNWTLLMSCDALLSQRPVQRGICTYIP